MNFLQVMLGPGSLLPGLILSETDGYYVISNSIGLTIATLRQPTEYPRTYAQVRDDQSIVFGYGPIDFQLSDEFLQLVVDINGNVTIQRDMYATLPIFFAYGKASHLLVLSNDYRFVAENTTGLTLNQAALFDLFMVSPDAHSTLWNEIGILNERHVLKTNSQGLFVSAPEPRSWMSEPELSDPNLFRRILATHLDDFISRFVKDDFGLEVSGGLDSTLLPLYYLTTHRNDSRPWFGSLIFPGNFEATQRSKLRELEKLGLPSVMVPIDETKDFPLAQMIDANVFYPRYSFAEIYQEPTERLAAKLAHRGVRLIATGMGGDELFETASVERQLSYGDTELQARKEAQYPPFLTAKMRELYLLAVPENAPYPLPPLSVSLYGANIARNNIYIERDIWPISPFADPTLYRYTQGLPVHLRANKRILRAFYDAYGFPEHIYKGSNEHFGSFLNEALASGKYDLLFKILARNSVTSALGFVDIPRLSQTFMQRDMRWLFHTLEWMSAEIELQR